MESTRKKDHPDGGKLDVRVKYGHRRNVCLCEKTPPATYDPAPSSFPRRASQGVVRPGLRRHGRQALQVRKGSRQLGQDNWWVILTLA